MASNRSDFNESSLSSLNEEISFVDNESDKNSTITISSLETWGYGFLFVTLINLSSILGIFFIPLMNKSYYTIVMRIMIGLAIGSLGGSALFHLIPQAFHLDEIENHLAEMDLPMFDFVNVAAFIWFGAWFIMIVECLIKIVVKTKSASYNERTNISQSQCEKTDINPSTTLIPMVPQEKVNGTIHEPLKEKRLSLIANKDENETSDEPHLNSINQLPVYHSTFSINKIALNKFPKKSIDEIRTVAWIIIIGDSFHNFIDGIAIGAAFVQGISKGGIICLAIALEELPHELGDFAILLNSGMTVKKALFFNLLSAMSCYLGLIIGILLGEINWSNYIFGFAAGIFLYVSMSDMIPEVTGLVEEVCQISPRESWKVLINYNIGIFIGVAILFILAKYQPEAGF